jgi:hypothetical protein
MSMKSYFDAESNRALDALIDNQVVILFCFSCGSTATFVLPPGSTLSKHRAGSLCIVSLKDDRGFTLLTKTGTSYPRAFDNWAKAFEKKYPNCVDRESCSEFPIAKLIDKD